MRSVCLLRLRRIAVIVKRRTAFGRKFRKDTGSRE